MTTVLSPSTRLKHLNLSAERSYINMYKLPDESAIYHNHYESGNEELDQFRFLGNCPPTLPLS